MLVKDLKEFLKDISDDKEIYFEDMYSDYNSSMYSIVNMIVDDDGDVILKNN